MAAMGPGVAELMQMADEAVASDMLFSVAAVLGWVAGTAFLALWLTEQQQREAANQMLVLARSREDDLRAELSAKVSQLEAELERERQTGKDSAMYKRRLDEASKEIFKLEKSLEAKDAQFEAFTVVAQRQIKYLESMVKELQKLPPL